MADAEAQRRAEDAERQRLAALKAEEERKAKAAADAEALRRAELGGPTAAERVGRDEHGVPEKLAHADRQSCQPSLL